MTMVFLDDLLNTFVPAQHSILEKLDATYEFTKSNNPEIIYRWFVLCLSSEFIADTDCNVMQSLENFLAKNGRGIYVKPLYRELIKLTDKKVLTKQKVKEVYNKNRSFYHSVIRNAFDQFLLN